MDRARYDQFRDKLRDSREWIPDIFAIVFDFLEIGRVYDNADRRRADLHADDFLRHLPRTDHKPEGAAGALVAKLDRMLEREECDAGVATVLLGLVVAIDSYLAAVDPCFEASLPHAQPYQDQVVKNGNLLRNSSGAIIPKTYDPSRGDSLSKLVKFLCRVRPDELAIEYYRDFYSTRTGFDHESPGKVKVRVGFVPVTSCIRDIEFTPVGDTKFCAKLSPCVERRNRIQESLKRTLTWMLEEKVHYILMPELAVDREIETLICTVLREGYADEGHDPIAVMCGSSFVGDGDTGMNRAMLRLGCNGSVLEQPKLNLYTMEPYEQKKYGLSDTFGGVARTEVGRRGNKLVVVDIPRAGRLSILTCEDLTRAVTNRVVGRVCASIVMSPVLDGPFNETRWAMQAAGSLVNEPGAMVFVCNSAELGLRQALVDGDSFELDDPFTYSHVALNKHGQAYSFGSSIDSARWQSDISAVKENEDGPTGVIYELSGTKL